MGGDILESIEENFEVENIRLANNMRVWPLLRKRVYFYDLKRRLNYNSKKRTRKPIKLIKNFFYGFQNIFSLGKFEYLFFENTNKRILIENKYYDIYFDAWADKLGPDKSLFIEFASNSYYTRKKVHSKNIISDLPFKLASTFVSLLIIPSIKNGDLLKEIQNNKNIGVNLSKELKRQLGEYYLYKYLFGLIRPRAVFVLSSFSKVSIVMAAKNKGIKVYEAQHGFIGESHPFYHAKKKRFDESYPDYLFSFGNYEIKNNRHLIFKTDQIIPIGGLELEHLKSKKISEELKGLKNQHNPIFCITLQGIREKEIIESTLAFTKENPRSLFFLCPKNRDNDYSSFLENSSYRLSEFSIYEILKISDYNLTIFSTTAVEAETMGAKTIFYNADNLSKKYFNISKLGAAVIEQGESLSEKHIGGHKKTMEPYYINGYFDNVKKSKIDL